MDTFTHMLIAYLLVGKFDMNLAYFAGFMAFLLDMDFLLGPFTKNVHILEHRGLIHSMLGASIIVIIFTIPYSIFRDLNFFLVLLAGIIGAFAHIFGDMATTYGIHAFWPFKKRHVKLDVITGINPVFLTFSFFTLPILIRASYTGNLELFNITYLIASIFFVAYFLIKITIKFFITSKFKAKSLPAFNIFKHKIVYESTNQQGDMKYRELKWKNYNILSGELSSEDKFSFPLFPPNPTPPLNTIEEMQFYSYHLYPVRKILGPTNYHVCEIDDTSDEGAVLFWYSLEFTSGRFKSGAQIHLKTDGTYKISRKYPFRKRK